MSIRALLNECRITHRQENKNHAAVSFVMSQATNDFFSVGKMFWCRNGSRSAFSAILGSLLNVGLHRTGATRPIVCPAGEEYRQVSGLLFLARRWCCTSPLVLLKDVWSVGSCVGVPDGTWGSTHSATGPLVPDTINRAAAHRVNEESCAS